MEKNERNAKNLHDKDKEILLKNFLRHIHAGEASEKEKNVLAQLKKSYPSVQNSDKITDKELKKAISRNRNQIMEKIDKSPHLKKAAKRRIHLALGGVAAIVLLLILWTFPFSKNSTFVDTHETTSNGFAIEKQFITGADMKKIVLSDGSTIFLNRETTVSLRQGKFNAHTREIWLDEGEAFFDVKKEINRPFIVHTPNGITTQVLGTSFNIRAYAQLEEQVISVNTGRVQVNDDEENTIILDPNYKVSVRKNEKKFKSAKTDATNVSAWRSGTIVLEQATIKEVAFRLKQAFDIDLIYENRVNENERIVTSFTIDTPQEEVLTTICKLYNTDYKRNNNTVELIK